MFVRLIHTELLNGPYFRSFSLGLTEVQAISVQLFLGTQWKYKCVYKFQCLMHVRLGYKKLNRQQTYPHTYTGQSAVSLYTYYVQVLVCNVQ